MKGKQLCLAASLCGVMLLLCSCAAPAGPSQSADIVSGLVSEDSAVVEKEDSSTQAVYQVQLPDDGRPVYWLHGWLEDNGEVGGKGISLSTYFGDVDVFIDCSMNSTTSSLDAPHW